MFDIYFIALFFFTLIFFFNKDKILDNHNATEIRFVAKRSSPSIFIFLNLLNNLIYPLLSMVTYLLTFLIHGISIGVTILCNQSVHLVFSLKYNCFSFYNWLLDFYNSRDWMRPWEVIYPLNHFEVLNLLTIPGSRKYFIFTEKFQSFLGTLFSSLWCIDFSASNLTRPPLVCCACSYSLSKLLLSNNYILITVAGRKNSKIDKGGKKKIPAFQVLTSKMKGNRHLLYTVILGDRLKFCMLYGYWEREGKREVMCIQWKWTLS